MGFLITFYIVLFKTNSKAPTSHMGVGGNWFRFAIPAEALQGFEASRLRGFEASRLGSFEASLLTNSWKESEARFEGFIRFWDQFWRMRVTLAPLWGQFGVTFGMWRRLWDHFGRTFRIWWRLGGNLGVISWSLLAFEGGLGGTLGLHWEHLRYMGVPLGSFWSDFGGSLGSVWVSVGDFVSLDGHFALMVESLWVY